MGEDSKENFKEIHKTKQRILSNFSKLTDGISSVAAQVRSLERDTTRCLDNIASINQLCGFVERDTARCLEALGSLTQRINYLEFAQMSHKQHHNLGNQQVRSRTCSPTKKKNSTHP